jgi:hypothetical protein
MRVNISLCRSKEERKRAEDLVNKLNLRNMKAINKDFYNFRVFCLKTVPESSIKDDSWRYNKCIKH